MKNNWIWMGHPAHLCVARDCKFFLATKVGKYIVSTVGEYFPDSKAREILEGIGDERANDFFKKIGYEDIGLNRKYETMVFRAKKGNDKCCPYVPETFSEIDMNGYNDPQEAFKGHYAMCRKWDSK